MAQQCTEAHCYPEPRRPGRYTLRCCLRRRLPGDVYCWQHRRQRGRLNALGVGWMRRGYRKYCKPYKFTSAKRMRYQPTPAEAALWAELRKANYRFRRQSVVLGWILDFWCPSRRVAVEVDGDYHATATQKAKDAHRDRVLAEELGILTVRMSNRHVLYSPRVAAIEIHRICLSRPMVGVQYHERRAAELARFGKSERGRRGLEIGADPEPLTRAGWSNNPRHEPSRSAPSTYTAKAERHDPQSRPDETQR